MESEKFCLRWNDFETNISEAFRELREEKDFFDVTLACDDNQIQAHKVIISACSPFFRNVLRRNPHQHPLLYLKGVKYKELLSVLNFMYMGEVNVAQEELNSFLSVAEDLKVKGLTQGKSGGQQDSKLERQETPQASKVKHVQARATPKRPRMSHPAPSQINLAPAQSYHQEETEEEIQEVVPVKSEPREQPPQPSFLPEEQHEQEEGTVALDESYAGEEIYDYQYEETGYQGGAAGMEFAGDGSGKDLESVILSKMYKNIDGDWQCNDCLKTSKVKTNIFEHIEATHVESPGYQCDQCYKFCRTRNALRKHKYVNHKPIVSIVSQ